MIKAKVKSDYDRSIVMLKSLQDTKLMTAFDFAEA